MSKRELSLCHRRVLEALLYDPETGHFTWRIRPGKKTRVRAGDRAGGMTEAGYRSIKFDDWPFYEHRLAWFYVHGEWPETTVDHVNLDKADNRLCNLRLATPEQQNFNQARGRANRSGRKGVGWSKTAKRWHARVMFRRKLVHVGYFDSVDEAHAAYAAEAKKLHGEFARTE